MGSAAPEGESLRLVPLPIGVILALYLGVTGLLLIGRTIQAAGVDTLSLVYSYHPDEGTRLTGGLYDLLRHPVYAGIDRVVLALGFANGTAYSLLLASIFVFVWHRIWIGLEETELTTRFGDDYRAYREAVPALAPTSIQGELALLEASTRRAPSVQAAPPESEDTDS
jgi:protein-S-isoprenylcysteine O-methyltransferase Ste14